MEHTYRVSGLTCGKCVERLTAALVPHAGTVAVTLEPPRVVLTDPQLALAELNRMAGAAGDYRLADLTDAEGTPGALAAWLRTYRPLLLIVGYLAVASCGGNAGWHGWMLNFMAGFFLVFSFFKLLNLGGFATAYASYDLLAARARAYALAYPFIELALGLAYLFRVALTPVLIVTAMLMLFGSLGVLLALRRGGPIQCACLGTTLNLPMSTVTIVEDLGMAAMALAMLAAGSGL